MKLYLVTVKNYSIKIYVVAKDLNEAEDLVVKGLRKMYDITYRVVNITLLTEESIDSNGEFYISKDNTLIIGEK